MSTHVVVCLLDIALVIDHSGSIIESGARNWQLITETMVKLVQSVNVSEHQTHDGAVGFSKSCSFQLSFNLSNKTRFT